MLPMSKGDILPPPNQRFGGGFLAIKLNMKDY
jgi:hypothetical protein